MTRSISWVIAGALLLGGCGQEGAAPPAPSSPEAPTHAERAVREPPETEQPTTEPRAQVRAYALAIHGGAGVISRDTPLDDRLAYTNALRDIAATACEELESGAESLDVVERAVVALEETPLFNAGRGAVFNAEGRHELDASIMRGSDHACGAVASVSRVRNPVRLARRVMEETRHVLLSGPGAEAFAESQELELVENSFFTTERRQRELEERLRGDEHGTVGAVALDRAGHLAAATSTGGLTAKRWGRIGDSPIIGAGTYADDATCAVSCTGIGEQFIRNGIARMVSARMDLLDEGVEEAATTVFARRLNEGDGGLIAVSRTGEIAFSYNTAGMFRARCGEGLVAEAFIWEELESAAPSATVP